MDRRRPFVRAASLVMMAFLPIVALAQLFLLVLYWAYDLTLLAWGSTTVEIFDLPPVPERRLVGIAAITPAFLLWLAALAHLFLLFRRFARGALIDLSTVRRLRGYALFAGLATLADILLSGARRWSQGEFSDQPLWTHIQVSDHAYAMLFTTAVLFLVSFALEEGDAFREETERYF